MLVIGAGVTLYEGLKAADIVGAEGIGVRVLDPFTIKPIDAEAIIANAKECGGRILVVEDHYPEVSSCSFLTGVRLSRSRILLCL